MSTKPTRETKFPTGTLVFGLILLVVAVISLSNSLFSWTLDTPLLFIAVVAVAGLIMVISGISSALRRNSETEQIPPSTD